MKGVVSLVGAGPGDPSLITLAGLARIRRADVIVYDRLVDKQLLEYADPEAELIYVGKKPAEDGGSGAESPSQEAINRILVEKAQQGKWVVRLKGGDPFVFGRGGEEAEALARAGVPFEVVPGVTSAVAVPAYAGIPVTHRGVASSFAVVTGHEDAGKDGSSINWPQLATGVDTLVFLMGVKTLPELAAKLIEHGRPPETPAAVIQQGTTHEQRTVTGTLADIAEKAREAGIEPPAITVVGEVVRLRDTISWFENQPLFNKRVLVTRTPDQSDDLLRELEAAGAAPYLLPAIEIEETVDEREVARVIKKLVEGRYDWIIFTSENAVSIFMSSLTLQGRDARTIGAARVAAVGPETAAALLLWGIRADVVPTEAIAEDLYESLAAADDLRGTTILFPRAEGARRLLVQRLKAAGAKVDELVLYRSVVPKEAPAETLDLLKSGRIDVVTFTSSSTVRNLVQMLGGDTELLRRPLIACIGPITAQTAEELGLRVDVVAKEHTAPGLVQAIIEACSGA